MNAHDVENDDDNEGGRISFGSAGGIGTPSSSRARMLAQQREIQLKKRATAVQSGGALIIIRSVSAHLFEPFFSRFDISNVE